MRGAGARALNARHYIFVRGGGLFFFFVLFCLFCLFFFFNPVGGWIFPAMMNINIGSREKLSPVEYTVLHPGKIRLKPWLFLSAI